MIGQAPAEPLGGTDDHRRLHWVVPVADGAQHVPDADAVWCPRNADTVLSVDPDLLRLLEERTGHAFRDEGE